LATKRSQRAVARNDWISLRPRPLGSVTTAQLRVTVVIPAHNCQNELDRCLAGLAAQSYPADLLDVIVVDDRSSPPLQLSEIRPPTTTIKQVNGYGHGSGLARDTGARVATGDVVLFLDADIIPDRHHVDAHVRWHELIDDAVVLGTRDFVEVAGLEAEAVAEAVLKESLAELVAGRKIAPHEWIDRFYKKRKNLTLDRPDLWKPVVGASVSVRRLFYEEMGGFQHFGIRGMTDTEFGYRAFTAGGVLIPEFQAYSLHQGPRSFDSRGAEFKRRRGPVMANYIPQRRHRMHAPGRQWTVPYVQVIVPAERSSFEEIAFTVDSLLSSEFRDLSVSLIADSAAPDTDLINDYWQGDGRVRICSSAPSSGFPSVATMVVPSGVHFSEKTLGQLVELLLKWKYGLIGVALDRFNSPVEVWATRALLRCLRYSRKDTPIRANARELFGELWVAGAKYGVSTVHDLQPDVLGQETWIKPPLTHADQEHQ
jgi:glycosyltransferase involved in cell wall biosynthesis